MIQGVNTHIAGNVTNSGNEAGKSNSGKDSVSEQKKTDETAVIASISEEGKRFSEMKMYSAGEGPAALEESHRKILETRTAQKEIQEPLQTEIDPFDNPFQIMGVTYQFAEGTLEDFISKNLEGKAFNPSLVASELGQKIQGARYNLNATVEERAIEREIALRNAEYIAENYFENPDEAKAFMEEINKFAETDILREKGYLPSSGKLDEYAKQFALPKSLTKNGPIREWTKAEADNKMKELEQKAAKVADAITQAISTISEEAVNSSMQRILKAFTIPENPYDFRGVQSK